jgi:hypothetical protein
MVGTLPLRSMASRFFSSSGSAALRTATRSSVVPLTFSTSSTGMPLLMTVELSTLIL